MMVGQITGLGKGGGGSLLYIVSIVLSPASDPGRYDDSSILIAHFKEDCLSAAGQIDKVPIQIATECLPHFK